MYHTVTGIALRTVRHNDRQSLLSLWTAELGRITVAVPATGGRQAVRLRALTMPLSLISAEVDVRPGRDIHSYREMRPLTVLSGISADPAKTLTALFLADFLETTLRSAPADRAMSEFLFEKIVEFDSLSDRAVPNYHLYLLLRLTRFFGIEPDWNEPGAVFDLAEGRFRRSAPLHSQFIEGDEALTLRKLARASARSLRVFRLGREGRRRTLDLLLQYYTIHHRPVVGLPSLAVLSAM